MVELVPMTVDEFEMYLQYSIQEYAQDRVKGGLWNENEALQEAEQQYQQLLPQNLETPEHYLSMIVDEKQKKNVGVLWFGLHEQASEQQAFVYDVVIFEEFRRRGYARQAMQLLEERAADLGADSISLHVLGHNQAARELYEKLDYTVTNINMRKKL